MWGNQDVLAGQWVESAMGAIGVREHDRTMAQAVPDPQDGP
jgi:hypothetical protein